MPTTSPPSYTPRQAAASPPPYTPTPTPQQVAAAESELTCIKKELGRSPDPDAFAERQKERIDRCLTVIIEKDKEDLTTREWMCKCFKKRMVRLQAKVKRGRDMTLEEAVERGAIALIIGVEFAIEAALSA